MKVFERVGKVLNTFLDSLVTQAITRHLRIGTGLDFHSLHEGMPLILGGVRVPHTSGFSVKRSDGDPVSHAIVDALLSALGEGDIADWFNDQDGVTHARSVEYLRELRQSLLEIGKTEILQVQAVILADKPKLRPYFPEIRENIAQELKIAPHKVSIQGKTFEGKGVIGLEEGIEVRAMVMLITE